MLEMYEHYILDYTIKNDLWINSSAKEIVNAAYMTTQYVNYGVACPEDLEKYLIKEVIENPSDDEIYDYLANNYPEDAFYNMDMFDELNGDTSPSALALMMHHGSFNPHDFYFKYDGYNNLESFDDPAYKYEYLFNDIKKDLLESGNVSDYIQALLDDQELIIKVCNLMINNGY